MSVHRCRFDTGFESSVFPLTMATVSRCFLRGTVEKASKMHENLIQRKTSHFVACAYRLRCRFNGVALTQDSTLPYSHRLWTLFPSAFCVGPSRKLAKCTKTSYS